WKILLPGSSWPLERGDAGCRPIVIFPFNAVRVEGIEVAAALAIGVPPAAGAVLADARAEVGLTKTPWAPPPFGAAGAAGSVAPPHAAGKAVQAPAIVKPRKRRRVSGRAEAPPWRCSGTRSLLKRATAFQAAYHASNRPLPTARHTDV